MSKYSDDFISLADNALRTIFAKHHAQRPYPKVLGTEESLKQSDNQEAEALMRVNHVGEVCAQALYTAQGWATQNPKLKVHFQHACKEENDHLAWLEKRLSELNGRTSYLNPIWYIGSFGIGFIAGKIGGDRISLGFVVETERQVAAHLQSHIDRLPIPDITSRAIVEQMKADELKHALEAQRAGAIGLPKPVKLLMKVASKVMTEVAHRV